MPPFSVTRGARVLVTVHATTDAVAVRRGVDGLHETLEDADFGAGASVRLRDGEIHDHPAAPFDPYEIAVPVEITVTVEADDEETAAVRGESALGNALDALGVRWTLRGESTVSPG